MRHVLFITPELLDHGKQNIEKLHSPSIDNAIMDSSFTENVVPIEDI